MAVTDEAIEKIKDMIVRGELTPGSRLPPEKDLAEHLGLSRNSMREAVKALEVIRVLESHATGLAAQRADDDDVAELDAEIRGVATDTDIENLVEHDVRFHSAIARLAGNDYLASLLESLTSQTVRARVWRGLTQAGAVERTLDEHRAILDAIADHDVELATAVASVHISGIERWLRRARDA